MKLYDQDNAILVPSRALQTGPDGQFVYVVKPDMTVEMRKVVVDRSEGETAVLVGGDGREGRPGGGARRAAPRARRQGHRHRGRAAVMNLSEIFIRRPVMTILVMTGILIFGIVAFRLLPVSQLPNIDYPTIQVTAELPGAAPDTMASAVATVLEKQFSTIAGIDSMTSISGQGSTSITIQFNLDRDIDAAAQDVNSAIAATARLLPPAMPTPPSFRKVNPADFPVFFLALTSDVLPISTVNEYAETYLAQRISTISGVAQVQVFGQQKYAVRVQVDPSALAARGVSMNEVQQAVASANVNLPTGTLYGKDRMFAVQATGQLYDAKAFQSVIVTYRNGNPVRLGEVGRVIDSVQTDKVAAWFKDKRGIVLAIQRQPGTNTIEVVDAVKKLLPTFRAEVPPSIGIDILYDRTVMIRASVAEVEFTLLLALALVVMVIFIFLRNIPATIIPSVALPMSIVGTFSLMYVFGHSLDNISLMALTLCVGFVVDDAIVMLENISRHIEMGKSVMQATLDGSKEIAFTIVSMTISLAAVFIPVFFMGGILGRLLHEFAVVIIVAVLISGFVSLTLTPMMCSRILKPHDPNQRHGRLYMAFERGFDAWRDLYGRDAALGARAPARRDARVPRHLRGHRRAVRARAQGLPAERGFGPAVHLHRGAAGRVLRGHGRAAAPGRRHRAPGPERRGASCPSSARATSTRR